MATLKSKARPVVAKLAKRLDRISGAEQRIADAEEEMRRLHGRIDELEHEVQESRRLHQRLAELTDVVAEVLVPASDRADERLRELLTEYNRTSF